MDTPFHWILSLHIFVSSFPRYAMHSYFMFWQHCYIDSPVYIYWLSMYSCCIDHSLYACYMDIHVFPLHAYFPLLILIFWLLDTWAFDMRCVKSHIYCFPFPVILFYYQQSSGPVIMLHVPCTVLVLATLCALNIINITWGWERLDGWLDLIGGYTGSIFIPL